MEEPVKVGTSPFADSHHAPSILVDSSGYIHVFYGCHGNSLKYAKSTNSEDISAWTAKTDITSAATYPRAFQTSDDKIWIFYRAGGHLGDWVYQTSADGGSSWSAETAIIDGAAPSDAWYATVIKGISDTFHVAFIWKQEDSAVKPEWINRFNVYYMFRDTDGNWKNIEGTTLTIPLSKADADTHCKVYDSGTDHTNLPHLAVDNDNKPLIVFNTGKDSGSTSHVYKFAKWTGAAWSLTDITNCDHLNDFVAIDHISDTNFHVYLNTGGTSGAYGDSDSMERDRGGNIEKWVTSDSGANWSKSQAIIGKETTGDLYGMPILVQGYTTNAKLVFAERTPEDQGFLNYHNYSRKIFLWGDSGFIGLTGHFAARSL